MACYFQKCIWAIFTLLEILPVAFSSLSSQVLTYPPTRTTNDFDTYFGSKVPDPYRWLENFESPDVQAWIKEETQLTRSYLDSIPYREYIRNRLFALRRCESYSVPEKRGGRYFYFEEAGERYNKKYYYKDSINSRPKLLLDFNKPPFNDEQAPTSVVPSPDGRLLAYVVTERGVNLSKLMFLNIDTGQGLIDTLKCHNNIDLVWAPDNSGVYYTEWIGNTDEPEMQSTRLEKAYWHKMGTSFTEDKILFHDRSDDMAQLWLEGSSDSRIIILHEQSSKNYRFSTFYMTALKDTIFAKLFTSNMERFSLMDNIGSTLFFSTAFKYPGAKIISFDLNEKYGTPKEIYSPEDKVIRFTAIADSHFVVSFVEDAYFQMQLLDLSGKFIRNLNLPAPGTINDIYSDKSDTLLFLDFESYLYPGTAYYYNLNSDSIALFCPSGAVFDFSAYKTKQYSFESSGGIQVPLFLTFRKDQMIDGNNPTLLYGYGAYGKSMIPTFDPSVLLWLENGGTYAVANVRGGGEFGDLWHFAGSGPNKQTSINDFIGAARWLIKKKITNAAKLAIIGESAGGLLVTASMNQHPDLFGAVVADAAPTDMLRYQLFAVKGPQDEWGDPKADKFQYQVLRAYSPYHNVNHKAEYPSTMIMTGGNDITVPPFHAFKYIASLQAKDDGKKPKLLRFEKYSTHHSMGTFELYMRKQTDIYTFLFKSLGIVPHSLISNDSIK